MKYSSPIGMGIDILSKVDEIKIPYDNISEIEYYFGQYPEVEFVIQINSGAEVNIELLKELNGKYNITLELINIRNTDIYNKYNLKWFWKYPIQTFYDLQDLKRLGADQVLIEAPLFFDLKTVKSFDIKVRVIANQCYQNYIPRENGIHGCWILPQHMHLYEDYVYMVEFHYINKIQYKKLLEVYKERKDWVEDCDLIFHNFNYHILGTAISEDLGAARLTCKQRCAQGRCHLCNSAFNLGNTITERMIEEVKSKI